MVIGQAFVGKRAMETLTLFSSVSVLTALVLAGTTLAVLRSRRRRIRTDLERRLRRFRFHKMLAYLGVDRESYIRTVPVEIIEGQLRRCAGCGNTEICDACLHGRRVTDMRFCPNYGSIVAQSRRLAARH